MATTLPDPIAAYYAAEQSNDAEALARCFAPDATVRDEGATRDREIHAVERAHSLTAHAVVAGDRFQLDHRGRVHGDSTRTGAWTRARAAGSGGGS